MGKRFEDMTEPELRRVMNRLAKAVESEGRRLGLDRPLFAMIVFNDPKVGQYVANCERACMIEALEEAVGRLKGKEDVPR